MKTMITKFTLAAIVLLLASNLELSAQVTPTTPSTTFICEGSKLDLGIPPTGAEWVVKFSATQNPMPTTVIDMTGTETTNPALTGFYYVSSRVPGMCESDPEEVPVYALKPLVVDFIPKDYCTENAATTIFTGSVSSPDSQTSTFAYQWYTVNSTDVEEKIDGATTIDYTPTITNTANTDINTIYRLKAGYLIGGNKYCAQTVDHNVKTLPRPGIPVISIPSTAQNW